MLYYVYNNISISCKFESRCDYKCGIIELLFYYTAWKEICQGVLASIESQREELWLEIVNVG